MYVKVEDLSFAYQSTPVLHEVNFSMEEGEVVAILGSSGSGKSTLLRLLSGLEIPHQGCIIINEHTLCSNRVFVAAEKREVGMVFQDYALFPHMSVARNIGFGLTKWSKDARKTRTEAMLKLIDMEGYGKRYPHELSGGQQQRVALARALAPKPDILLLDEPFSNLDADLREKIRMELRTIMKQTQMTSILVTHDYDDAVAIADRVVHLEGGRIIREKIVER